MVPPTADIAFDRLRQEAKRLLKELRRGDAAATRRFTQYWPTASSSDDVRTLVRAQLVIARENGYRSWAHLKASLLTAQEKVMQEQKKAKAVPQRRLGVYTYEEAEALLGIPVARLQELVEQLDKKPRRFLDTILLEKVWVTAKPFIVTLRRDDHKMLTRDDLDIIQDALYEAGAMLAMDMAQLRFATLAEAEQAAAAQAAVPGYTWITMELGLDKTMEHLKTVWSELIQRTY